MVLKIIYIEHLIQCLPYSRCSLHSMTITVIRIAYDVPNQKGWLWMKTFEMDECKNWLPLQTGINVDQLSSGVLDNGFSTQALLLLRIALSFLMKMASTLSPTTHVSGCRPQKGLCDPARIITVQTRNFPNWN